MALLDPVELARRISQGIEDEDPDRESPTDLARRLSGLPPEEEDEGFDIFQPIRTFFGASQGVGGAALGAVTPEAYEKAKEEMRAAFGVTEASPWYEETEALPGVGDVAAQYFPQELRESLLGRAVGPVGRMAGNILGDPTTYIGGIVGRLAKGAVTGIEGGEALLKAARIAKVGRADLLKKGVLTKAEAALQELSDARKITQLVLEKGTPAQQRMFKTGIGLAEAGPLAMGAGAALAYGPAVVKETAAGVKRTIEAEGVGETTAEAANTMLMAGLSALMAKGLIDAGTATRTWHQHLRDTGQIPKEVERMEAGLTEEAAGVPPEGPIPVAEGPEMPPMREGPPLPEAPPVEVPTEVPPMPAPEGPPGTFVPEPGAPTPIRLPPETEQALLDLGYRPAEIGMLSEDDAARILAEVTPPERVDEAVAPATVEEAGAAPGAEVEAPPLAAGEGAPEAGAVEAPPVLEPEAAPAAEPLAEFEALAGGDLDAVLARRGVTREEFAALDRESQEALFAGTKTPEEVGLTRPAPAEAPGAPERPPTEEPGVPAPEEPVAPAEAPAPQPAEAAQTVMADKDFQTLMEAEGQKQAVRAAKTGEEAVSFLDRVHEALTSPEAATKLRDELGSLPGEIGSKERRRAMMAVLRKAAREQEVRAQELGAGGQAAGAPEAVREAALATATEGAEKAGKAQKLPLKEEAKIRGPDARLGLIQERITESGEDFRRWMYRTKTWKGAKKEHRDIFLEYLNQRGRGLSRKQAIDNVRQTFSTSKLAARTYSNIIGKLENGVLNEAGGVEVVKRTEEEITALRNAKKAVAFPQRAADQPTELFAEAMRQSPQDASQAISRFLRFARERDRNRQGLPADLRSIDDLKQFARDLGLDPAPKEELESIIVNVSKQLGIDPMVWPEYMRQLATQEAAGGRAATQFALEGFTPKGDEWRHPSGLILRARPWDDNRYVVEVVKHGDNPDEIAAAMRPLLENPRIEAFDVSDARVVKGVSPVDDAMGELGLVQIPGPENFDGVLYGVEEAADNMAARGWADSMEEFVEGYTPYAVNDIDTVNAIDTALGTRNFATKLRTQVQKLGADVDLDDPAAPLLNIHGERAVGTYHALYKVNGAVTPDGNGVVLRVGRSPSFAYPTSIQQALVMPILGKGVLFDDMHGPMFYTIHPEMRSVPPNVDTLPRIDRTGLLSSTDPVTRSLLRADFHTDFAENLAERAELEQMVYLPDGMSLQENLDAHADLLARAEASGLRVVDVTAPIAQHGPGRVRFDQFGWIPVDKPNLDMVTYRDLNGKMWRLVFSDFGTIFPDEASRAGTVWEFFERNPHRDFVKLSLLDLEPDRRLSMAETLRRQQNYEDDFATAVDIGDGLVAVNNDRLASDTYVQRNAELGAGAARGLRRVVRDLRDTINARDDVPFEGQLQVDYDGLTTSPHLSGLHLPGRERGQILSNVVEAVNAGASYDDAVEKALYTVIHEVTHNKNRGHGTTFLSIEQYVKNIVNAEKKFDQYKRWLKEEFTEADYRAMREELVPEFRRMRKENGARESWRRTSEQRLPVGSSEGRIAASPYRRGGGEAAVQGGGPYGVQPRGAVQRGGAGPAGGVRRAPTPGELAATRRAEGEAARPVARRGTAGAASQRERIVSSVQTYLTRGTNVAEDVESAKRLIDESVEKGALRDRPVREIYEFGWEQAGKLLEFLTDDEIEQLANSLPAPRRADQVKGAINMLHSPDLPVKLRARWKLLYDMTKGHWSKDKTRRWHEVDAEVKELLGLDTPENWALAFRNRGGGLKDRDVLLLKTVWNELSGKQADAELRYADALRGAADGKVTEEQVLAAKKEMDGTQRAMLHSGLILERGLAGVGRALAIARKDIRRLDPQQAWRMDLLAGLRERIRTKVKDPVLANKKAGELLDQLLQIQAEGGDWGEFYRAYRDIMSSKLWPDKVLEWYKAGLLGWPSRVANLTSNGLFRAVRYVEDSVAGLLDYVGSGLTGEERNIYAGELSASTLAARRALLEALPTWITENQRAFLLQPDDFMAAVQKGSIMEDLLHTPGAIEGKLGEFVRFQLKGLAADDRFAKHMSRMDTYYRMIYRQLRKGNVEGFIKKEGETLAEATERLAMDLRDNYENARRGVAHDGKKLKIFQPIAEEAERIANEDTFQEDLGNFGRGFQSALRELPFMQVFFPFVRTPTNIAKQTIKRTPLGFIRLARKWNEMTPAQRMTEMSKPITGTAIGMGIMALAMTGDITGGGPIDFNDREAKKRAGWEPYSALLGDQWISFQRFEPIAALLGIAADASEGLREGDFDTFEEGSLRVMQSAAENVTNKTFMSGMDALASAFSNPKQALGAFLKQMQGSLIPNSIGFVPVGHLARSIDGVYRQVDPMTMDAFYNKIPFMSSTLMPQYTPTGELRERPGSAFERLVSPFARREVQDGPVAWAAEEIVRVDAAPQPPKKYWYGRGGVRVEFNKDEKELFAKALLKATQVIGEKVIKDPNYLKLPDNEADPRYRYGTKTKQEVLRRIFQKYRSEAMKRMRRAVETRARKKIAERVP
jgi:hypothetical protein